MVFIMAQVGVGTVTLAAALDVNFSNDGLLIPRLAFLAKNVATVLPQTASIVYNTFTSALGPNQVVPGYYFIGTEFYGVPV